MGIVVVTLMFFFRSLNRKATLWEATYANNDTRPYGTYITYQLLKDVFKPGNISSTRKPIYNNLKDSLSIYFEYPELDESDPNNIKPVNDSRSYSYYDEYKELDEYKKEFKESENPLEMYDGWGLPDTTAYIFVNKSFEIQKYEIEYLLDFVGLGNNVFISAETFSPLLTDTLGIEVDRRHNASDTIYTLTDYPQKKYSISHRYYGSSLKTDSCKHPVRVLAKSNGHETVFIQVKYGNGSFFFHTVPNSFINYNQLDLKKYDFAYRSLSYIPKNNKILWDEYQTQGPINSIFREMFKSSPLIIALIIIIVGFLLFMIFRAKRTQRIIPIIKPPVNSSIEFLDTISNLFYKKRDMNAIANKRHAYFLDFIRKNYYMTTEHIDADFIKSLSAKSGMEEVKLNELFELYRDISTLYEIPSEKFLKYNSLLEEFYRKAKHK